MMRHALLLMLLPSVALAQQATQQPPPPDRVCVPRALLEQWAAYTAGRPWNEVATVLERLRAEMQTPQPCPPPASELRP